MLKKSRIASSPISTSGDLTYQNYLNYLYGNVYHFEDSQDIVFESTDIFYKRSKITNNLDMAIDGGYFFIEKKGVNKYEGTRYGATLFYNNFSLRLGINQYENFSEIVPTIKYQNSYKQHNYTLEYTRQNALFYTYSLCSYEKRVTANHFSASDYVALKNNTDLWSNVAVNKFSNNDTEVTGQFDWRFFYDTAFNDKFSYYLAAEGWYTSHTLENSCFYSPEFADSTLLRVDPQYVFSKYLGVRTKFGAGFSATGNSVSYKYGAWLFGNPTDKLSYTAGCLHSNAAKISADTTYNYLECKLNLGYEW